VPVAAAGLADVVAADPDPRIALREGEHVGKKFAVGLLDEGAVGECAVGIAEAGRERVADLLQLTEVEHPRRPGGADPVGDGDPAHALGDQAAQLELQLGDLPAQLGARLPLLDAKLSVLCHPLGYKGQTVDLSPVEQIYHEQILSRLEGRGGNP
jgi:hypothetical protein